MSAAANPVSILANPQAPPRQRVLEAASDLFYRHGIRAVGVEAMLHACDHCTHKQFFPELDPEQLAQVYGDLFSSESERESYAVHYRERLPPYRDFAERVLQLTEELGLPRSARIHEFGCGAGITVKYLRDLGFEATGSDWSPSAIRFAREMGNEHIVVEDMNTPEALAGETVHADVLPSPAATATNTPELARLFTAVLSAELYGAVSDRLATAGFARFRRTQSVAAIT